MRPSFSNYFRLHTLTTGWVIAITLFSCSGKRADAPPPPTAGIVVYTGATIIDGEGGEPITGGILVVKDGRFEQIGTMATTTLPADAVTHDLQGKFVVPGIINGHGHVGETLGIEGGHYSKENVVDNLAIYARYGVTTVVSLGGDSPEAGPVRQVNDNQYLAGGAAEGAVLGETRPDKTTATLHARLYIAGAVVTGATPAEGVAVVDSNAQSGVDFMKIRVDDNLGTSPKMPEEVYRAVINRSHEQGYQLAAHLYYLDDARKLVGAGADILAHSIRDLPVPPDFVQTLKEKNVPYCPTLTRELSTFVFESTPEFFNDPFFTREFDSATVAPLRDPARQRQVQGNKAAAKYKAQLPVAKANLKTLSDARVPIVFGTDSGVPTRFMGYFEHVEMSMMNEAGMTPMQIIVSASKTVAEQLDLKDLGTIKAGNWADFIVLDADPLADIRNMRLIRAVFIGGNEVKQRDR